MQETKLALSNFFDQEVIPCYSLLLFLMLFFSQLNSTQLKLIDKR